MLLKPLLPARRSTFRPASCALVLITLLISAAPQAFAQEQDSYNAERARAFQLISDGNFVEAQKSFEKLAAANQSDARVMFGLGLSILANSKNIKEDEARRQARLRARRSLLRAKELGFQDDLLEVGLASIPPDGGEGSSFSRNAEAHKAMEEGEAAFTRRDYDQAIAAYERASRLDPKLYEAPLFIGDMYFQKQQWGKAAEGYSRAIAINPDRETAYRYWSDALLKQGKLEEAFSKAIEAIIAEPYNRMAFRGLLQWAQVKQVSLGHPRIDPPNATQSNGNQTNITIDPKSLNTADGSNYWLLYDLTRVSWARTDFFKAYPGEKTYRHSLLEEAAALRAVAAAAGKDAKSGKIKTLNPALESLVKLNDAGLLEAYILFARPDEGIARDYETYRRSNREKLRRYWTELVASTAK
ncbi:MAG TPA: tetratricopeptide repeat protein [Pyrinomonadaceae bacterium]|jgi:tetratricopeptide (TPR) repeat protein